MRPNKFAILVAAAIAGFAVYKVQVLYFSPDTAAGSDSSTTFYANVNGPGSLAQTYKSASAARSEGYANPQQYQQPNYGANQGQQYGRRGQNSTINQVPLNVEEAVDDLPIIQAAAKGDKKGVESRLANGARVNSRDGLRRTALMYASWNGNEDICLRLLAAGANPEFKDRDENNAFDFAASRGLSNMITFLLKYTKMTDDKHYFEHAQLMQAVYAGDPARLPAGNAKLSSVNRVTPEGQAPLHIAAGNGSVDLMKLLIARGAMVDIPNAGRQTPLLWAAWNNQPAAIQLLLQKGADINKTDSSGNTALIMATQNAGAESVKFLIAQGADVRISNKQGKNAAIIAEDNNRNDLASLLK